MKTERLSALTVSLFFEWQEIIALVVKDEVWVFFVVKFLRRGIFCHVIILCEVK